VGAALEGVVSIGTAARAAIKWRIIPPLFRMSNFLGLHDLLRRHDQPLLLWMAIHVEVCYSVDVSGGGPRVKHHIERPISDVVVTENLIGSLT